MRLLLDTHVFLWAASEPGALSAPARGAVEDRRNEIFISAVVGWEMTIKHALGKLALPLAPAAYVPARLEQLGFKSLPISLEHALALDGLPAHHNDLFDRIMIAQAQVEGLTFVSADQNALKYPVQLIPA